MSHSNLTTISSQDVSQHVPKFLSSKKVAQFWATLPKINYLDPAMGTSSPQTYHMLELISVSHTGPIIPANKSSIWSRICGTVPKGLILKDISLEVYSGEVMAILGSKGSGKRALIDVIGHRIVGHGSTKGQILLNDVPLTLRLFQEQCGFVSKRTQFIDGLTVRQSLYYMAQMTLRTGTTLKKTRIKQVLADLALSAVASKNVSDLTLSESKRLAIGLQLVRDPLLLVLDDPTADLDPLNTYFVISILSNHAKKYGRIIVQTMDKPRSDIFPFLDRVTYLCLGDVVYTGSTRMMMDYFRNIGFPCPELENPLMYYLCLSTVDRRSRDRFVESSGQIAAIVDKFKLEGHEYRKFVSPTSTDTIPPGTIPPTGIPSIPLTAYGRASSFTIFRALLGRQLVSTFTLKNFFKRILLLPLFFSLFYLFLFPRIAHQQPAFQTKSGLFLNCLLAINFITPAITAYTFSSHRNRFYEESSRLSLYRGPLFILTQILTSIPFNIITIWLSSSIVYWSLGLRDDNWWIERWTMFCAILWAVHTFAEQHTIGILCFVKSPYTAALTSIAIINIYLVLGNGFLRSMLSAPHWIRYLNFGNIYYYAYWFLSFNEYQDNPHLERTPSVSDNNYSSLIPCPVNIVPGRCLFLNGPHFLSHRFREGLDASKNHLQQWSITHYKNFALTLLFILSSYAINTIVYIVPIPASIKSKFRD